MLNFSALSGAYMLWDESYDDLKLVGGAGLVQSGNGQNTFTGNVDASGGLDVTGAAFIAPSITQSGSNEVTFTGASTFSNTITVGVDNTDTNVKFFGAIRCIYVMG